MNCDNFWILDFTMIDVYEMHRLKSEQQYDLWTEHLYPFQFRSYNNKGNVLISYNTPKFDILQKTEIKECVIKSMQN